MNRVWQEALPWRIILSAVLIVPVLAIMASGEELTATTGATVQRSGPRRGDYGTRYFNIQGQDSPQSITFASFGVLGFPAPEAVPDIDQARLTLTLTQSLAQFSRAGRIRFYLAEDDQTVIDPAASSPASPLRFDATTSDGLGKQFPTRHYLGSGEFKPVKTGHTQIFPLTLDEKARDYLHIQIAKGGPIRIVLVPEDAGVVATYFGTGEATVANRPRLRIAESDP